MSLPPVIGITGTDTEIGKTVVSAALVAGLQGAYWKPVQAGMQGLTDTEWVKEATGLGQDHFLPERYRLEQPLSPHLAARLDGVAISVEQFTLPNFSECSHLIIEGAGGVLVPLNDREVMADLFSHLRLPVIVVARSTLGTINHTLLTINELRRRQIEILGVVLNGPKNAENRKAIAHFGQVKILGEIEPMNPIDPLQIFQQLTL